MEKLRGSAWAQAAHQNLGDAVPVDVSDGAARGWGRPVEANRSLVERLPAIVAAGPKIDFNPGDAIFIHALEIAIAVSERGDRQIMPALAAQVTSAHAGVVATLLGDPLRLGVERFGLEAHLIHHERLWRPVGAVRENDTLRRVTSPGPQRNDGGGLREEPARKP